MSYFLRGNKQTPDHLDGLCGVDGGFSDGFDCLGDTKTLAKSSGVVGL